MRRIARATGYFFMVLGWMVFLFSCQNPKTNSLLAEVEEIIREQPEEALSRLENMQIPDKADEADYASYILLMCEAKYRSYQDITQDTLLPVATAYYLKIHDLPKIAKSYLYEARILLDKGELNTAMYKLLLAKNYAIRCSDYYLLGWIHSDMGWIYGDEYNFEQLHQNYLLAQFFFEKGGLSTEAMITNIYIGEYYFFITPAQTDSAFLYLKKVIDYAEATGSIKQPYLRKTYRDMAIAYQEAGNYDQAKEAIKKAMAEDPDNRQYSHNAGILAELYFKTNQVDSTFIFLKQLAENDKTNYRHTYAYHYLLHDLYKSSRDYEQSLQNLEFCLVYFDSLYQQTHAQSVLEIQKKYERESLENAYNRTLVQRLIMGIVLLSALTVSLLLFFLYKRNLNKKNRELESAKQSLVVLENLSLENTGMKGEIAVLLLHKLQITKKLNEIKQQDTTGEFLSKYKELFKNLSDESSLKNEIYAVVNKCYTNFICQLKKQYSKLGDREILLCCFFKAQYSTEEIALLMGYTNQSVTVKKARLCRKMGFAGYKEFDTYIEKFPQTP